jgi:hypothetical protein
MNKFQLSSAVGNCCSTAGQEIHHFLCSWKVHYHVHNIMPLKLVVSQRDPAHLLKICFNIIQPFKCIYPDGLFLLYFFRPQCVCISHLSQCVLCHMPHPSHNPRFEHPNKILWRVQIMKFSVWSSVSSYIVYFPSSSNISLTLSTTQLL